MIAKEGYPFIGIGIVLSLLSAFIHSYVCVVFVGLTLFVVYFFRNPTRQIPVGDDLLISSADGKVIDVSEVDEDRFLKKRVKKISIFMSPFNVHINRIPVSGTIKKVAYNRGKFLTAFHEKASLENEQNAIFIENKKGIQVLFVQIAGWLARRIVCYAKANETWNRGDIFGLIRFGSRMDLYIPLDSDIQVQVGQKVKGGESIIAKL